MKFVSNADLVGLHPGMKRFLRSGSSLYEIAVPLEETLQALLDFYLCIPLFNHLLTAKTERWSGNGVLQQIVFLSKGGES